MITREQLELAALAAGYEVVCTMASMLGDDESDECGAVLLRGVQRAWRPHLDDGDAARLAAAVGMKIITPKHSGDGAFAEPLDGRSPSVTVYRKDRAEQMRIAIVLCAAAVGERLRGALAEIHGEFVNGSRQLYTTTDSTLDRIRATAKNALEGTK